MVEKKISSATLGNEECSLCESFITNLLVTLKKILNSIVNNVYHGKITMTNIKQLEENTSKTVNFSVDLPKVKFMFL